MGRLSGILCVVIKIAHHEIRVYSKMVQTVFRIAQTIRMQLTFACQLAIY